MREPIASFEKALEEQGVSNVRIHHHSDEFTEYFTVKKDIAGDTLSVRGTVTPEMQTRDGEKEIAILSRQIAEKIEQEMVQRITVSGRDVEINPYETPTATCLSCGESVTFNPNPVHPVEFGEVTTPNTNPSNTSRCLSNLTEYQRVALKMALYGKLNESCGPMCASTEKFI
jgi:hypothetical protein